MMPYDAKTKKEWDEFNAGFAKIEKPDIIDEINQYGDCRNCQSYNAETTFCKLYDRKIIKPSQPETVCGYSCFKLIEKPKDKKLFDAVQHNVNESGDATKPMLFSLGNFMKNVEFYWHHRPFFWDTIGLFWKWNTEKTCYELSHKTAIMNDFEEFFSLDGETIPRAIKDCYHETFMRVGLRKKPKEPPVRWIQFKDRAFSLRSKKYHAITPDFHFTNPIPWDVGIYDETPTMDKLFKEWVGVNYVAVLYEIIAYCCYRDYPIHTILCMIGGGRNGKSQFLELLRRFLGQDNVCDSELDDLALNRFEQFSLYKKLACCMGETNFDTLHKTSKIKKLTGGDYVSFEKKHIQSFSAKSYCKIIIASNSLPSSTDTSDGFYRRWMIIPWLNEFKEGKPVVDTIPDWEYSNLSRKICKILPIVLDRGRFTMQGSIEKRKEDYIKYSNPLKEFIQTRCIEDKDGYIEVQQLYTEYVVFLKVRKMRKVIFKEFKGSLEDEGFWIIHTSKKVNDEEGFERWKTGRFVDGLKLK